MLRRWISCCFLGLTWRRSSGCRWELWHGGRRDPPGHPRWKARARAAAANARRDRGQAAPGPPRPPRSPASCAGVALARAGCQAGGSCAHRPSVKKSCGEQGQRGEQSPGGVTARGQLWDTHNDEGVEQGPVERQEADDVCGSALLRGPLQVWGGMGGGRHGTVTSPCDMGSGTLTSPQVSPPPRPCHSIQQPYGVIRQ